MPENKTKPTAVSAAAFIGAVEPAQRREDAETVCALMQRISGEPPVMWGPSIIGFGTCHYRYDSGREGDMPRISFSPRKASLVLYVVLGFPCYDGIMARLGKYTTGKPCLASTSRNSAMWTWPRWRNWWSSHGPTCPRAIPIDFGAVLHRSELITCDSPVRSGEDHASGKTAPDCEDCELHSQPCGCMWRVIALARPRVSPHNADDIVTRGTSS